MQELFTNVGFTAFDRPKFKFLESGTRMLEGRLECGPDWNFQPDVQVHSNEGGHERKYGVEV